MTDEYTTRAYTQRAQCQQDLGYYYYNVCDQRRYRESKGGGLEVYSQARALTQFFFIYLEFHRVRYLGYFFLFFLLLQPHLPI